MSVPGARGKAKVDELRRTCKAAGDQLSPPAGAIDAGASGNRDPQRIREHASKPLRRSLSFTND